MVYAAAASAATNANVTPALRSCGTSDATPDRVSDGSCITAMPTMINPTATSAKCRQTLAEREEAEQWQHDERPRPGDRVHDREIRERVRARERRVVDQDEQRADRNQQPCTGQSARSIV